MTVYRRGDAWVGTFRRAYGRGRTFPCCHLSQDGMSTLNKADEMACRELVQVITAYLEGTLPGEDCRRFDAHLEECPYCVTYLDQMRETVAALGGLSLDFIAPERRRELLEAFDGWHGAG